MKKNRKKSIKIFMIIMSIIIIIGLVITAQQIYKERKVEFADDMMRQVMCLKLGYDTDYQKLTYREIEKIEELRIGPVGEFETLEDISKCKNLKVLIINTDFPVNVPDYELYKKEENGNFEFSVVEDSKVLKMQEDLEKIFRKVPGIEKFIITNAKENFPITEINFLREAKNVKDLSVCFESIQDYSALEECKSLEELDLWNSDIDSAKPLLKLKNIKRIDLTGTPLSEDEEELEKLKEAFPDAKMIIEYE